MSPMDSRQALSPMDLGNNITTNKITCCPGNCNSSARGIICATQQPHKEVEGKSYTKRYLQELKWQCQCSDKDWDHIISVETTGPNVNTL